MATVVQLRNTEPEAPPASDPVFFTKEQVTVGTILLNCGRTQGDGSHWRVTRIVSFVKRHDGYSRKYVQVCNKLVDDVYMTNTETGDKRICAFHYLSYSAIWRLA